MNKNGIKLLVVAASLLVNNVALAQLYKWVDDKGQVHYSDSPSGAAEAKKVYIEDNGYAGSRGASSSSGGSQSNRSGKGSQPGVDAIRSGANAQQENARNKINQQLKNSREQHSNDMKRQEKEARLDRKRQGEYQRREQSRQLQSAGNKMRIGEEARQKTENTLTQCQRFPDLAKCRAGYGDQGTAMSQSRRDEQEKIKQWQNDESKKIDKKYLDESLKDYNKTYNNR